MTPTPKSPDQLYAQWENEVATGVHDGGVCNDCGLPVVDHPLPDRFHESTPEHCAAAKANKGGKR